MIAVLPQTEQLHRNANAEAAAAHSQRVSGCFISGTLLVGLGRPAAQRRPLSRGSNPCGYPHKPLVSYRINRQLSVWILPPLYGDTPHNMSHPRPLFQRGGAMKLAQDCRLSNWRKIVGGYRPSSSVRASRRRASGMGEISATLARRQALN
jgi:hypothetical protein